MVVSECVESSDRISVVGEPLVTGNMTLHRPALAAVERFIEAYQVVIPLGAHEPFGLPDQVVRVGGVHSKVRLAVVVHEEWTVPDVLCAIRPEIFTRICAPVAGGLPGVTVRRPQVAGVRHLRCVTAGLLRGGENVGDMTQPE